jgi:hypothetical protein
LFGVFLSYIIDFLFSFRNGMGFRMEYGTWGTVISNQSGGLR